MYWDQNRRQLFQSVYAAVTKLSRYAPFDGFGAGLPMRRNLPSIHLAFSGAPGSRVIGANSVLSGITVRDVTKDSNRLTGIAPNLPGLSSVTVMRGGLYTSEDVAALLAELNHYADAALPRDRFGKAPVVDVVQPKAFFKMQATRELLLVDLDTSSAGCVRFFAEVQQQPGVSNALATLGYRSLLDAVAHASDYSAARALGLGLASNPEIDGLRITSARGFSTADVTDETGNNLVLFGADQQPLVGMVRVTSIHLVESAVAGTMQAIHFLPSAIGTFVESGATPLP